MATPEIPFFLSFNRMEERYRRERTFVLHRSKGRGRIEEKYRSDIKRLKMLIPFDSGWKGSKKYRSMVDRARNGGGGGGFERAI